MLAFSGLSDLFERLPEASFNALPEVQEQALQAALFFGELPEGDRHVQALPRAVLGVLRQLAAAGPALIAIDDEQWLDPASARVLAFALCRLRHEPVAAILARRPAPKGMLSTELEHRFRGRPVETVSLAPLPMSTIKAVVEGRLNRTISRPLLRRIQQAAGGNPLYAVAIALELEARHTSGDGVGDLPMPRTLTDAIELRLEHLDPRANEAMLAIAVLSQPTLGMLQAALPEFALSDLESAERAGVIEQSDGRLRFTHPLLSSTHYTNTPVSRRRQLHRRLATVIADEEERARHLAIGAEAPDRDIADTLQKAAGMAARRGATESAAQLLEDAARLTPMDEVYAWTERMIAAAEHRFISGEASRARHVLEELIPDLPAGPLRAQARLRLALTLGDEPTRAFDLLEEALADAADDDRWRVEIESELGPVSMGTGHLSAARAHVDSAVRAAERLGDPTLVAKTLGHREVTFVCSGEPLDYDVLARLAAMEDSTEITTYQQPSTTRGLALYWAGDTEAGRPLLERAVQRALSRGEEWDRLGVLLTLAHLEWDTGNWAQAERHRRAAADALGEFGEGALWLVWLDARFAFDRGELEVARRKAEHGLSLAERTGRGGQIISLMPVLAAVELLSGEAEAAHARLEDLRELLRSSGFGPAGSRGKAVVWSQDVEALIATGRLEDAGNVLTELHSRAEASGSADLEALAWRSEGLLRAARGNLLGALDAMETALAAHAQCHWPLEHGRTLLEKGSIERRAKRKAAAKRTLEEALAILEPLEASFWIARTRDELSRIGLRRARATDGLTPAQSRVAELVAAGLTNPEIARELHMSLRTVESHLSRIYRQHGVRSRSQLVAALVASDSSPRVAHG